jgi:hypothetical protein
VYHAIGTLVSSRLLRLQRVWVSPSLSLLQGVFCCLWPLHVSRVSLVSDPSCELTSGLAVPHEQIPCQTQASLDYLIGSIYPRNEFQHKLEHFTMRVAVGMLLGNATCLPEVQVLVLECCSILSINMLFAC